MSKTSIAVVGGGPGGYVAAIRAAQLGGEVTLIEKAHLGGTCLNIGCIPTKALIHSADLLNTIRTAQKFGISAELKGIDWPMVLKRKEAVVHQLVSGVSSLMAVNKIRVINGEAAFVSDHTLQIKGQDGIQTLTPDKIILATGSKNCSVKIPGAEGNPACVDSTGALNLDKLPKSLLVIGGGVIGIELADAYHTFGVDVTIVEATDRLLPIMDGELTKQFQRMLEKRGLRIMTKAHVESISYTDGHAAVKVRTSQAHTEVLNAEKVLIAIGRKPNIQGLALDKTRIRCEHDHIVVDDHMETNISGVYAIGDCTGKGMLAHTASAMGEIAAENCMGNSKATYCGNTVPSCIYVTPEFAGVGLTEETAKKAGIAYIVGKFPMSANGRALIEDGQGTLKVLLEKECHQLIGLHILGPRATDLIAEGALAIQLEATAEEIISTIHAHPSVAEAIRETVLAAEGRAIHIPPERITTAVD